MPYTDKCLQVTKPSSTYSSYACECWYKPGKIREQIIHMKILFLMFVLLPTKKEGTACLLFHTNVSPSITTLSILALSNSISQSVIFKAKPSFTQLNAQYLLCSAPNANTFISYMHCCIP